MISKRSLSGEIQGAADLFSLEEFTYRYGRFSGEIGATIKLSGTPSSPAIAATFRAEELKINDLYTILSRAALRYSLLTRVFEIGALHSDIDDIVTALTDGQLFRLDETNTETDQTILEVAEALQTYFNGHFDEAADAQLREAWMRIEDTLRTLKRNI